MDNFGYKDKEWINKFINEIDDIRSNINYVDSSKILRRLIKSNLLKFTDMRDDPDKFFQAHRLLLAPNGKRGCGFGIRFTVQYNLFAGSILGLGNKEQIEELNTMQNNGTLGCFCLTEKLAGVNSGLVVNTTIYWIPQKQMFCLNSPNDDSNKNWISQGLTADKAVVIAKLIVDGKNYGPHGFIINMRDPITGNLIDGIIVGDMGDKTTANDLDNAWVKFNNLYLPKESMLRRFCDIQNDKYIQTTKEPMRLEVLGQRLLTGRLAIAESAVVFARNMYDITKSYSDNKKCWSPGSGDLPCLSDMPQVKALYNHAYKEIDILERYCSSIQSRLSKVLKEETIPDSDLVEAIAVAKIEAVTASMDLVYLLKREVGSFALMGGTGFEFNDFFLCCAFAEGDTRILMQKIARDKFKSFKSQSWEITGKSLVLGSEIIKKVVLSDRQTIEKNFSRNIEIFWYL